MSKLLKGCSALIVMIGFLTFGASVQAGTPQKEIRAAFVYVGPVGDAGWTYAHNEARKQLEKEVPYVVETAYTESVPEGGGEATRIFSNYARRGFNLIIGTAFGYTDPIHDVAKQFPKVTFENSSGLKMRKNLGLFFGRMYQATYLAGITAGLTTKRNKIGYVAAHPIPVVIRALNGFALGVKSVNPNAEIRVVWTSTWYDPAKEAEAANSLLDVGVDVVAQYQDSPAAVQAAERRGKFSIGHNSDMHKFAPKHHLTDSIYHWIVFYKAIAEEVHNGTWKSHYRYWGLEKDAVGITPVGKSVPAAVAERVNAARLEIREGKRHIFAGPIKDQESNVRISSCRNPTDLAIRSMNFIIEGVIARLPKGKDEGKGEIQTAPIPNCG